MQPIRSYVVRIYRQGRGGMDGVVEDVKTGKSAPFHSVAELWDALRAHLRRGGRKEAPPRPAGNNDRDQ